MLTAIGVLLAGIFLVFIEFFLPGGIFAVGGALLIFLSLFMVVSAEQGPLEITLFLTAAVLGTAGAIKFAMVRLRASKKETGLYGYGDQEGFRASSFDTTAVGKTGIATSPLRPSGIVTIDDKRFQAIADTGFIDQDANVLVTGGRGGFLIVKSITSGDNKS